MSLDTTNSDPLYVFGRVRAVCFAAIEEAGNDVSRTIINQLQIQPLAGFAMLHTKYLLNLPRLSEDRRRHYDDLIGEIMELIPGADFVEGPIDMKRQGIVDIGYHHQRAALRRRHDR